MSNWGTSYQEGKLNMGTLWSNSGTIKEFNHNHPNGNNRPSSQDLNTREALLKAFPQINLNVYTRQSGYRSYTTVKDILKFYVSDYVK